MKVILQDNVVKLGKAGDIVEASPGYFRNFLQPRKLAVVASEGALKKRQEDMEVLRKKAEKAHQQYVELADKITALGKIRLSARVGEGGKLYGKITNKEIAQALESELKIEVDKRLIKTNEEVNSLGTYKVIVKLAPDVQSTIVLELISEGPIPEATTQSGDAEATKPDRAEKE
ncbi:MAG: 50S ribosomal protein L9 [Candidatus Melainabacteria bacterium]|nr:MAG: 50S ribosomal protein L9 [Candidatus Melainabacteria bacterium]